MTDDRLPRPFLAWLGATSVSAFGDSLLYFALGWAASGIGPSWTGVVTSTIIVPRVVLFVFGGAVGDRRGVRRIMIVSDAVMCGVTVLLAAVAHALGITPVLLLATALALGVVNGFYLPASGSFPRLFVSTDQLPRALSLRQSATQIVSLFGPFTAGVVFQRAGLVGIAVADAATFAVVLAVLVTVAPPIDPPRTTAHTSMWQDAAAGIRLVRADPLLSALLLATGLVAAFVLPMTSVCIPLIARHHGWTSSAAGFVDGATACGALAVSLVVARRGRLGRPGLVCGIGPLVASLGMVGIAVGSSLAWSITAATIQGIGIGLFVTHMAPLVMAVAPHSHQARVQSLIALVQTAPLLVSANAVAAVAGSAGSPVATACCAAGTAAAGVNLLARSSIRAATIPTVVSAR